MEMENAQLSQTRRKKIQGNALKQSKASWYAELFIAGIEVSADLLLSFVRESWKAGAFSRE